MTYGSNLKNYNVLNNEPLSVDITWPALPTDGKHLAIAYLPGPVSVYLCMCPMWNSGKNAPSDKCWKLPLGSQEYEPVCIF